MRYLEARFAKLNVAKEQDVEIERAGVVGKRGGPVAAELLLDAEEGVEQGPWLQVGFQRNHRIHEARLVGKTNGLGTI